MIFKPPIPMVDQRKYGPKLNDHPSIGEPCPACGVKFKAGDMTTLVVLVPENSDDYAKMMAGEAYNAPALEVHWECRNKHSY